MMLRYPLIILAVVYALVMFSLLPLAERQSRVTVVALTVKKPVIQRPSHIEAGLESGMENGTTLSVLLTRPDKCFISVREGSSHLLSFRDNKGTNLLSQPPLAGDTETREYRDSNSELSAAFSNDGHTCAIEVSAPGIPANGATTITATNRLVLLCGFQPTTVLPQRITIKVGSKLVVGPSSLHIKAIDKQDHRTRVTFASSQPFLYIQRLAFFAPNGHSVKIGGTGHYEISQNGDIHYENTYEFSDLPDTVTVHAVYFKKVEALPVTFSVKTGLGF